MTYTRSGTAPAAFLDPAVWVRGLGMAERAPLAGAAPPGAPAPSLPARWLREPPYQSAPLLARRLAVGGLDEREFARRARLAAATPLGGDPPPWAVRLDALLDGAPAGDDLAPAAPPLPSLPGFAALAEPIVADAWRRLHDRIGAHPEAVAPFLPSLLRRVAHAVARTCVLELHVARLRGELVGATGGERFEHFCARLRDPAVRRALLTEYVVLARWLLAMADDWVDASAELARRLAADRDELRVELFGGEDPGAVTEIQATGDSHARGRCVQVLRFSTGRRVVYKPRSLAADVAVGAAAAWLNGAGFRPALAAPRVLDRGAYGWAAYVEAAGCDADGAVGRFYERLGAWLALLHVVGTTDMHLENLIAAGEHPVPIDLETVMHPRLPVPGPAHRGAAWDVLRESVTRVGLLPTHAVRGAELSGIGGAPGQLTAGAVPVLANAGTDEMVVERRRVPMQLGENRPRVGGRLVAPEEHVDAIAAGFARAYELAVVRRDELLAPGGVLDAFAACRTRAVLRDTRVYGGALTECGHPDHLRDAAERDRHLDRLWAAAEARPYLARVVEAEQADIRRGDVPAFASRPDSTSLWASDGTEIPAALDEAPLAAARRRVLGLSAADGRRQIRLIRAAVATLVLARAAAPAGTAPLVAGGRAPAARRDAERRADAPAARRERRRRWRAVARACRDRLLEAAIVDGADPAGPCWIAPTLVDEETWALAPLGDDLYGGRAGVALFLAYAGRDTGSPAARDLAARVAASVGAALAPVLDGEVPPADIGGLGGAFRAVGGAAYLFSHLGALWRRPALADRAEAAAVYLGRLAAADDTLDVIGGSAGAVLVLRAVAHARPGAALDRAIRQCADRLVETATQQPAGGVAWHTRIAATRPLTGLSHGASGMALALAAAAAHTGDAAYARVADAALAYERACFAPELGNWPDFRRTDDAGTAPRAMLAWCHGAPGIALARAELMSLGWTTEAIAEDLRRAVAATRSGFGANHSLCHGDLGNLEALSRAVGLPGGLRASDVSAHEEAVLGDIEQRGPRSGAGGPADLPGLMMGIAGIGLAALRAAHRAGVPTPLAVEPAPARYRR